MPVELLKKEIEVPKELAEILQAVVDLAEDIKASKDIAAIAAENLPGLMAAFDGYDKLDEELKAEQVYGAAGFYIGKLLEVLLKKSDDNLDTAA